MKKMFLSMAAAGMLLGITGVAAAEDGRIKTRKERQQKRIAKGVENGSLTPGEAARLEHKERKLNQEIREERQENGHLTKKEKAQVNRQQNKLSRDIHKQKHDGQNR
jgi:hypothetical protein